MPKSVITLDIFSDLDCKSLDLYMLMNEEKILKALVDLLPAVKYFEWSDPEEC